MRPTSRKGEDVLDAARRPEEEIAVRLDRIAPGDEGAERRGPALVEDPDVTDGGLERLVAGVHGAEDYLVLENQVPHDDVGVDLDRGLPTRHAGEDEDA